MNKDVSNNMACLWITYWEPKTLISWGLFLPIAVLQGKDLSLRTAQKTQQREAAASLCCASSALVWTILFGCKACRTIFWCAVAANNNS